MYPDRARFAHAKHDILFVLCGSFSARDWDIDVL